MEIDNLDKLFFQKIILIPFHPCWEWIGSKNHAGYGVCWNGKITRLAHRVSYEVHFGPYDQDLKVLHRCDNPGCVNPTHLSLGTDADNARDKMAKGRHQGERKTHCPRGHAYSGDNLIVYKRKYGRACRECHRMACREYLKRKKEI